ncbi:PLP-dependent transferase [Violaceomyces palustris]|uniref:PLP-dependent transferase n=1 Tax=Violaceomyces palustris TaxID=1673888 RepID=A0ACD0NNP8_9BASI|nr:PLP-dependent transferase [Violaceomyces palustris]
MDIEGFRKAGYQAVDRICDYYYSLEKRPVLPPVQPGFLSKSIPDQAPEEGEEWVRIEDDYQNVIMPGITHWQHPNFYAYFPCNASFEGALADLHCAAISNPGFNWSCSPSVTELEILMMDWIAKMLGFNDDFLSTSSSGKGGGIILGSASEVTLTVAIAARERAISDLSRHFPPPNDDMRANGHSQGGEEERSPDQANARLADWRGKLTSKLVMYGTTQTHSVGAKAALILGLNFRALEVKAEDAYALRGETLKRAIEEDKAEGRLPFLLVASLGTTSSGAVDNLTEIAQVASLHPELWLHVDSAYAGVALSLPEEREASHLDAINGSFDSFSTNLHKWGLVQFDCSPLLVRDRGNLSRALTVTPEFLRTKEGDSGSVLDLRNLQIPLGRRFRSLKVWFVLRSYGLQGFRDHLRRTMSLSRVFESCLIQEPDFEIVAPPRWAMVVFRLNPASNGSGGGDVNGRSKTNEGLEKLNRELWEELEKRKSELLLTQTVLPEVGFCIRFVVGSPQTRENHVRQAWNVVYECGRKVLEGNGLSLKP